MSSSDTQAFDSKLWLPRPRTEVFAFFADARNLDAMTPPWLRFVPKADPPPLAVGVTIDYRFRWHGWPLPWRSEIVDWRPERVFTYRQARGPYRRFLHEHQYFDEEGGTLLLDRLSWATFGGLLARPLVRRDLRRIFAYRDAHVRRLAAQGALKATAEERTGRMSIE